VDAEQYNVRTRQPSVWVGQCIYYIGTRYLKSVTSADASLTTICQFTSADASLTIICQFISAVAVQKQFHGFSSTACTHVRMYAL
jgi:hypothetical protein